MANSFFICQDTENVIKVICRALISSKQENVRELFIRRTDFISDLSVTNKHCDYLLHALFVTLVCDKCTDLLSKMSPESVKKLKEAVVNAKSCARPDKAAAERLNQECFDKTHHLKQSQYESICNNIERYSAIIASHIADFWDDAIAELDKWLSAIEEFQRNAPVANVSKENVSKDAEKVKKAKKARKTNAVSVVKNKGKSKMNQDKSLLSIQELADKLEMSVAQTNRKKAYVLKKNPAFKPLVESYFIKKGAMRYFRAECFDDFVKLLGDVKKYKPRAAKATKTVKVVDVPAVDSNDAAVIKAKLAEVVVQDDKTTNFVETVMPAKPTDLTGIVGLQKILDGFMESYQIACDELDAANKECDVLLERTKKCKDPQERTKLLALSQQANDRALTCIAVSEGKKDECELVSGLLKQAQEDSEAARKANQKWEETLAQVNAYIEFATKYMSDTK